MRHPFVCTLLLPILFSAPLLAQESLTNEKICPTFDACRSAGHFDGRLWHFLDNAPTGAEALKYTFLLGLSDGLGNLAVKNKLDQVGNELDRVYADPANSRIPLNEAFLAIAKRLNGRLNDADFAARLQSLRRIAAAH